MEQHREMDELQRSFHKSTPGCFAFLSRPHPPSEKVRSSLPAARPIVSVDFANPGIPSFKIPYTRFMITNIVVIPYILEYKPRFLFPSKMLETRNLIGTGVYEATARKCLAKHTTSSFFQLLNHLCSLETSRNDYFCARMSARLHEYDWPHPLHTLCIR